MVLLALASASAVLATELDAGPPLKAGSYMFHPANGVHWDGANGDEEAIVQIIGHGPATSSPT